MIADAVILVVALILLWLTYVYDDILNEVVLETLLDEKVKAKLKKHSTLEFMQTFNTHLTLINPKKENI